ncbi:MAG: CinA family protein [Actinomycetaceae bacterium]|nr:CinA family protein [Actinomycetaceae bacterium]
MVTEVNVNQNDHLEAMAHAVLEHCEQRGWTLATAESLTAGMLCARLCDIPGASQVVRGGVIAYATDVKQDVLSVDKRRLADMGPVDQLVSEQMAEGACRVMRTDVGVSTTGVAGPEPQAGHAVGEVHIAVVTPQGSAHRKLELSGNRQSIRHQTVDAALAMLLRVLTDSTP